LHTDDVTHGWIRSGTEYIYICTGLLIRGAFENVRLKDIFKMDLLTRMDLQSVFSPFKLTITHHQKI